MMGGVPSVPKDSTRPLKVIGAGYSRTGTLSMALALEKLLDGPVMHGGSQLLAREDGMIDPALLVALCISNL
jgi:Sulfotransferase domain